MDTDPGSRLSLSTYWTLTQAAVYSGMDVAPLQLWTVVWMWHPYSCGQWYGCGTLTYSCGQWYGCGTLTYSCGQWYGCGTLTAVDSGMDVVPLLTAAGSGMAVATVLLWTVVWMWHPYICGQLWNEPVTMPQATAVDSGMDVVLLLTAVDSGMDVVPLQLWTVVWMWYPYSCGQFLWMWYPYSCGQWYGCGTRYDATDHSDERNKASRELDWGVFTAIWV